MMRAILSSDLLQTAVEAIIAITDDVEMHMKSDRLTFRATDRANVAFVEITFTTKAFNRFETEEATTSLYLDNVATFLDLIQPDQALHCVVDPAVTEIIFQSQLVTYRSDLLAPLGHERPHLWDNPDVNTTISGAKMNRVIRAANLISDEVIFGFDATANEVYCAARGESDVAYEALTNGESLDSRPNDDLHSTFGTVHLPSIQRAIPDHKDIHFKFSKHTSLAIEYPIADGTGSVTYILAPKI